MNQGHDGMEQRIHPRLQCGGSAEMHFFPGDMRCEGNLADLSIGGCCIELKQPVDIERGTHVEVYLRVMGTTVQVAGVLCHVRNEVWAGIQFMNVSHRKAEQIQELIEELFEGAGT